MGAGREGKLPLPLLEPLLPPDPYVGEGRVGDMGPVVVFGLPEPAGGSGPVGFVPPLLKGLVDAGRVLPNVSVDRAGGVGELGR